MLQLADIPLFLTKPLDTSHTPSMTPCTHSDSQTHFGLIKAALKSWLVSILHFFLSPNAHPRWGHRSKFACRCTYPSPYSTNSIQRLQLPRSCLRELLCSVLPLSALLTIRRIQIFVLQLLAIPQISFSSTSSPTSILSSIFFHYSISTRFFGLLKVLPGSPAVCIAAINALSSHSRSSLSNANVLMP